MAHPPIPWSFCSCFHSVRVHVVHVVCMECMCVHVCCVCAVMQPMIHTHVGCACPVHGYCACTPRCIPCATYMCDVHVSFMIAVYVYGYAVLVSHTCVMCMSTTVMCVCCACVVCMCAMHVHDYIHCNHYVCISYIQPLATNPGWVGFATGGGCGARWVPVLLLSSCTGWMC